MPVWQKRFCNRGDELPRKRTALAGWVPAGRRLAWCRLAALAVVAVAAAGLTTGCSVTHPATSPSGMENQIINGERVSAATRIQAAQQEAGRAAPAAASAPEKAGPRARGPVHGRQVTAIGDSVMAAGAAALASVLPGIYIDAKPDRQMPAGLAVVRRLARTGQLRPVVVAGLGTNYLVTTGQLDELLRLTGPHRKLVLINTYVPDQWSKQVNATEAAFARKHPEVVLADWYATIKDRTGLLWPDHIHPMIAGTRVYARLVYQAVQATRLAAKA